MQPLSLIVQRVYSSPFVITSSWLCVRYYVCSDCNYVHIHVLQELAEIRQVLEVRELKMVEMSRESITLREVNQSLEEELAEARRTGQTDVDELRSEFTRRLATAEKKFQAVVKVSKDYNECMKCTHVLAVYNHYP